MHPLDLFKTRMQLQVKTANVAAQTGNNVSFVNIHANNGWWHSS
jgi:hypothetical protein